MHLADVNMSTEIGDLIFETGKTLFQILDELDVTTVSIKLDAVDNRLVEVDDQLRQLGVIVDSNDAANQARFINIETDVNQLENSIGGFDNRITQVEQSNNSVVLQVTQLTNEVNVLSSLVASFDQRITTNSISINSISAQVGTLTTTINDLVARQALFNFLFLGNEYIFHYRPLSSPRPTQFYRLTFSGNTQTRILSNTRYSVQILRSEDNTAGTVDVWLAATFDTFSVNNRRNYSLQQGPILLSFFVNETSPITGYITQI